METPSSSVTQGFLQFNGRQLQWYIISTLTEIVLYYWKCFRKFFFHSRLYCIRSDWQVFSFLLLLQKCTKFVVAQSKVSALFTYGREYWLRNSKFNTLLMEIWEFRFSNIFLYKKWRKIKFSLMAGQSVFIWQSQVRFPVLHFSHTEENIDCA